MLRRAHGKRLFAACKRGPLTVGLNTSAAQQADSAPGGDSWEARRGLLLETIAPRAGIEDFSVQEEWKKLDTAKMSELGGMPLLRKYNGSILAMVRDLMPEQEWDPRRCRTKLPQGYWDDAGRRKAFLEQVAAECGVQKPDDWKKVPVRAVLERGGGALLTKFGYSLIGALRDAFPEQEFSEIEVCKSVPRGYWRDKKNRRELFERVAKQCNVVDPCDWSNVTCEDVRAAGGASLLGTKSLKELILEAYPELSQDDIGRKPRGYWDDKANRRKFLTTLAEKRGLASVADWSILTVKDLHDAGAGSLLTRYSNDVDLMLRDVLPELFDAQPESWNSSSRKFVKASFWEHPENIKAFLDFVAEEYRVESEQDWARISVRQVIDLQGGGLLRQMKLINALRIAYPKGDWESATLHNGGKRSDQRRLMLTLADIFVHDSKPGVSSTHV